MKQVSIINTFQNIGGSEWEAYELGRQLSKFTRSSCWSISSRIHPYWSEKGVRTITPLSAISAKTHNIIQVGIYWRLKPWHKILRPERQIILTNTFDSHLMPRVLERARRIGPEPELVYVSNLQRSVFGTPGEVHPSPVDLEKFSPEGREYGERFVLGRLSRDELSKHNVTSDPRIYRFLGGEGFSVRLMGATCMTALLRHMTHVDVLPVGAEPPEDFLRSLDCFYYWPGAFLETCGRVVFEAMASGIPVVAHRYGGYSEFISHEIDGFIFDTESQAKEYIHALALDPELRKKIGMAARKKMESIFSGEALKERADFYIR